MNDVYLIEKPNQAHELFKPLRLEILSRLGEPHSCPELAKDLGLTTQKVYYHVKVLETAGLLRMVRERRVRGIMEGVYRATARSYWLSPRLVQMLGGHKRVSEQLSLQHLFSLAEDMQIEIGHLASRDTDETPSLGISAHIELPDEDSRTAFLAEIQTTFKQLAEKYGAREHTNASGDETSFRLMLACYPHRPDAEHDTEQID